MNDIKKPGKKDVVSSVEFLSSLFDEDKWFINGNEVSKDEYLRQLEKL